MQKLMFCTRLKWFSRFPRTPELHNSRSIISYSIRAPVSYSQRALLSTISATKKKSKLKWLLLGSVVAGAGVGAVVQIMIAPSFTWNGTRAQLKPEEVSTRPAITPSRQILSTVDNSGLKLTLYQYQTCPFCCKVRAFLDYHGFCYDVVEVNPVLRKEIKWSSYRKVPILVCESNGNKEQHFRDSPLIISIMKTFLVSGPELSFDEMLGYYPTATYVNDRGTECTEQLNRYAVMYGDLTDKDTRQEEKKWREWADNTLVHYLSPNVYRTSGEALQAFRYFSDVGEWERLFPAWERYLVIYVGAAAMFLVGKRLKKKYNMKEDVRETLYDACRHWTKHVGKQRTFMGGDKPNLADLAVYGILNSIEGCEAFQDVLTNTKIGDWYYNTQQAVKLHVGSELLAEHCYDRYFKRKAN